MSVASTVGDLLKLALALSEGAAVRHAGQATARMACVALVVLAASSFALAGVACALAALWIYTVPHVGPAGAPLIVAGVLLAISLAILAVLRYGFKPRQAPRPAVVTPDILRPEILLVEATRLLKQHKLPVLLAALLAGLAAGRGEK